MSHQQFALSISPSGEVTFIYDDVHAGLMDEGEATTTRASHVEPQGSEWIADMSPVDGPVLGPFRLRREALDAEVEYLKRLMF